MRKVVLIAGLLLPLGVMAQQAKEKTRGWGVQASYAFDNAWSFGGHYKTGIHAIYLEYTGQPNGKLGSTKSTQLSNYGQSGAGSGEYYDGVTVGYGLIFKDKIGFTLEGTLGAHKTYQNYHDRRFKDGGYNMIIAKKGAYGWGGTVRYNFTKWFAGYVGYNTLTLGKIGIILNVYKPKPTDN